jgi:hypothetical protein
MAILVSLAVVAGGVLCVVLRREIAAVNLWLGSQVSRRRFTERDRFVTEVEQAVIGVLLAAFGLVGVAIGLYDLFR